MRAVPRDSELTSVTKFSINDLVYGLHFFKGRVDKYYNLGQRNLYMYIYRKIDK